MTRIFSCVTVDMNIFKNVPKKYNNALKRVMSQLSAPSKPAGGNNGKPGPVFPLGPLFKTGPASSSPNFISFKFNRSGRRRPPPLGYIITTRNGKTGYYKNNKALESQLNIYGQGPRPRNSRYGRSSNNYRYGPRPSSYNYRYGPRPNNYRYGPRHSNYGRDGGGSHGGITFAPRINVGAARIGAQTFGATRVGGQTMGGSRAATGDVNGARSSTGNNGGSRSSTGNNGGSRSSTGNNGGSRATTGNNGGSRATTGNNGGSRATTGNNGGSRATTGNNGGSRSIHATSEQLIREAGGSKAIEEGVEALRQTNGNVIKAREVSKLPMNTFTNIYALGGPVAAKKIVTSRRRRRTVAAKKKKHVAPKPRKQYIKLTPYQFRRLTDHIKKNNLRKVLIKEITH